MTLIQFSLDFFENCPERFEEDYIERTGGEVKSEWFPNMPLLREKANYKANDRTSLSDKEVMEHGCEKIFKDDMKRMTGGLQIVTCTCPRKIIYGFKTNITGESPKFIQDFMQTRAELNYNPTWVFDAGCIGKEVMFNREPQRAMLIRIVSDPLHADNHTACAPSYNSKDYPDMKLVNAEACEQFNSLLLSIKSSVSYMIYHNYIQSVKMFIQFYNMRGLD